MKSSSEMNYEEFCQWAIEYVVGRFLEDGLTGIRGAVRTIVGQVALNEVFGGKKK